MKVFSILYEECYPDGNARGVEIIAAESRDEAVSCIYKLFKREHDHKCFISNINEIEHEEGHIPAVIAANVH